MNAADKIRLAERFRDEEIAIVVRTEQEYNEFLDIADSIGLRWRYHDRPMHEQDFETILPAALVCGWRNYGTDYGTVSRSIDLDYYSRERGWETISLDDFISANSAAVDISELLHILGDDN